MNRIQINSSFWRINPFWFYKSKFKAATTFLNQKFLIEEGIEDNISISSNNKIVNCVFALAAHSAQVFKTFVPTWRVGDTWHIVDNTNPIDIENQLVKEKRVDSLLLLSQDKPVFCQDYWYMYITYKKKTLTIDKTLKVFITAVIKCHQQGAVKYWFRRNSNFSFFLFFFLFYYVSYFMSYPIQCSRCTCSSYH